MHRPTILIILAVSLLATPLMTRAQSDDGALGLEEIVVTATRRETTLQDVPASIQAVTGDQIVQASIDNLEDLSDFIPNVTIAGGLTNGIINIRGLGSGQDRSFEQSAALFVDGIYYPRSRQYRAPFFDLERVEVLRGPQAVLYGLNATAGTVNVISARSNPGDETVGRLTAGYETEYSGYTLEGVVGGSPSDTVGLRLAARYRDTGDGYTFNQATNQDEGTVEEIVFRGTLVWEPTETFRLTAKYDYADADRSGGMGEAYGPTANAFNGDSLELNHVRNVSSTLLTIETDRPPGFFHETNNLGLTADWGVGDYAVTAIYGFSQSEFDQVEDTDAITLQALQNLLLEDYEQNSFELRVASPADKSVSFIAGVYYSDATLDTVLFTPVGPLLVGPNTGFRTGNADLQDTEVLSPYVNLTFSVSDDFRINAGIRHSSQDKDYQKIDQPCYMADFSTGAWIVDTSFQFNGIIPAVCGNPDTTAEFSSDNLMYEVGFQYDLGSSSTLYAKVNESAKGGGIPFSNIPNPAFLTYDDEIANSIELGLRGRFADNRLDFNAAIFRTDFEDLQLLSFVPDPVSGIPASVIRNAGTSISQGIEIDTRYAATDWLTIGASVGYLDSEFDDFPFGPCAPGEAPNADVNNDGTPESCNRSGDKTPNAPEWSGNVFADIDAEISDQLRFIAGLNVNFSTEYFTEGALDPAAEQSSYERIDARIGVAAQDGKWNVSLIGKNLSDEVVNSFTQPLVGNIGYPAPPRTVTLQGSVNF